METLLSNLRDIHLSKTIGWWPLAPGWYMLMICMLLMFFVLIYFLRRFFKKRAVRQNLWLSWLEIKNKIENQKAQPFEIALFIKKLVLFKLKQTKQSPEILSAYGDDWLAILKSQFFKTPLPEELALFLKDQLYQKQAEELSPLLLSCCEIWLKQVFKKSFP